MFVVIFEVAPKPDRRDDYLAHAKTLKPELERVDGFIDNERFSSKRRPGWMLSLSTWRDEKALVRWRTHGGHRAVQKKGRTEIFRDYRIRIGEIIAEGRPPPPGHGPSQERFDETQAGAAKIMTITERPLPRETLADSDAVGIAARLGGPVGCEAPGLVEWDAFRNLYRPDHMLLLLGWRDAAAVEQIPPGTAGAATGGARQRTVRVIRDYGMHERAEAPQYYPPVADDRRN